METTKILNLLPYSDPFLFVDDITEINENGITGNYTFKEDAFFYQGHFKNNPVTPGVILTECMAQIGLVCLGIFLISSEGKELDHIKIGLSSTDVEFFKPVFPGETVQVISSKTYFRFNKLKCSVKMLDTEGNLICKGSISGMMVS